MSGKLLAISVLIIILCIFTGVCLALITGFITVYDGDGNDIDLSDIMPGDMIIIHDTGIIGIIVPGYWDHNTMYIGNGTMIEAVAEGVVYSDVNIVKNASEALLLRVSASDDDKRRVIDFAKMQIGKPYNTYWIDKHIYADSYYCSEICWAAYYDASDGAVNIDGDEPWWYFNAVAPSEMVDSSLTTEIAHGY